MYFGWRDTENQQFIYIYYKGEGTGTKIKQILNSKIKQNRLIKHQLFTSDVDIESWLKFLNI